VNLVRVSSRSSIPDLLRRAYAQLVSTGGIALGSDRAGHRQLRRLAVRLRADGGLTVVGGQFGGESVVTVVIGHPDQVPAYRGEIVSQ